jgi:phage terminase small subunit
MLRSHPAVAIVADADRRYAMWLSKFGLTPSDRSRVSAAISDTDKNPFAQFG